jgi:hypothetical protein
LANARGAAQILDRSAQAAARGAARFASQILSRGAQAVARGAATLPQQEKGNSVAVQQSRVNITGFICTENITGFICTVSSRRRGAFIIVRVVREGAHAGTQARSQSASQAHEFSVQPGIRVLLKPSVVLRLL